jgi:hypothetical protein
MRRYQKTIACGAFKYLPPGDRTTLIAALQGSDQLADLEFRLSCSGSTGDYEPAGRIGLDAKDMGTRVRHNRGIREQSWLDGLAWCLSSSIRQFH